MYGTLVPWYYEMVNVKNASSKHNQQQNGIHQNREYLIKQDIGIWYALKNILNYKIMEHH